LRSRSTFTSLVGAFWSAVAKGCADRRLIWSERQAVGKDSIRLIRCLTVTTTLRSDDHQRVRIEAAADHLDLIPTVAGWHWVEWGRADPQGSPESWVEALMTKTNRDRVPATWIAMFDDLPVGSVSLVEHDMPDRPDLAAMSPWLAGLYVLPTHRRLGIATQLVTACELGALRMGIARVYLYSSTARLLYERLGWKRLADDFYEGESITILAKDLNRAELSGRATGGRV